MPSASAAASSSKKAIYLHCHYTTPFTVSLIRVCLYLLCPLNECVSFSPSPSVCFSLYVCFQFANCQIFYCCCCLCWTCTRKKIRLGFVSLSPSLQFVVHSAMHKHRVTVCCCCCNSIRRRQYSIFIFGCPRSIFSPTFPFSFGLKSWFVCHTSILLGWLAGLQPLEESSFDSAFSLVCVFCCWRMSIAS